MIETRKLRKVYAAPPKQRGGPPPGVPHMDLLVVSAALVVLSFIFWTLGKNAFLKRAVG